MYLGALRTEKKKVGRWLPASEMLIVSVCFSWSRKWIGEDAEKEEEGNLIEVLPSIILLI